MAVTYPGVYIKEVPSGVRTIVGVATSITAMIGSSLKGPVGQSRRVQNFSEYERVFGKLSANHPLGYSVQQYFLNGGNDAEIVRVAGAEAAKSICAAGGLDLVADSEGVWMDEYEAEVDHKAKDGTLFNLILKERVPGGAPVIREVHRNLSTERSHPRYVANVLREDSRLVDAGATIPTSRPTVGSSPFSGGNDGKPIIGEDVKKGLLALERVDLFNLLVIPPLPRVANDVVIGADPVSDANMDVYSDALSLCEDRRALLLLDPPTTWRTMADARTGMDAAFTSLEPKKNAAVYFPMLKMSDPLREGRTVEFPPSAAVAGVFARTDANRGVWKAPAGQTDGVLAGVKALSLKMTDGENGQLNPLGLNCLRTFPITGNVIWGARTLDGADQLASEWKYVPIRRLALFIEESLLRGTQFAVFEPNDEPLWAQLRSGIGSFMQGLFRQGAFQGQSPSGAYFVKVDGETTTEDDRNLGIVNIHVGFAPLKPAEFVVIHLQQMAGQTA